MYYSLYEITNIMLKFMEPGAEVKLVQIFLL